MTHAIKDFPTLKKLLWFDFAIGSSTGILGLAFYSALTGLLGLSSGHILTIALITLFYSIGAFVLARQNNVSIPLLRTLVGANWVWTFISIGLLIFHFNRATGLGLTFLILQIVVVGGLAYLEGNQIVKNDNTKRGHTSFEKQAQF